MGFEIKNIFPYIWSIFFGNHAEPAKSLSGITIAFVGRSGSGMSSLIHDATGSYATNVAPDDWHNERPAEPYTDTIQSHGYTIPGVEHTDFPLVFIDTPGFNSSSSQNDVHAALRRLYDWLKRYKPHTKLDGLVFMHDVSIDQLHNRPTFSPRENIMEKLCGSDWAQKVVFVSSHWDQIGQARQEDIQNQIKAYWSVMQSYTGAPKLHEYGYPGTSASAWKTLRPLVERALTNRKNKLDEELLSLRDNISSELYHRVNSVVRQKTDLMQKLVPKLGKGEAEMILSDEERDFYKEWNREALNLWKNVENELNIVELERLLTVGLGNDMDKIRKINIAVVGSIKSGKSQFIYDVTGQRESYIASECNLHPHTKEFGTACCIIQAADLSLQWDCHVTLIDTPGFDYLDQSNDEKVGFASLLNWVRKRFGGPKLDGMVYLHSIQHDELDNRISLSHYSQPLQDLWRDNWNRRIVFVNSFWSEDFLNIDGERMSSEDMERRQRAIKENYLNLVKVPMTRYDTRSGKSAKAILCEALLHIL